MPTVFKYIKALAAINLFNGALWMEEEDIVKVTETQFNSSAIQAAIAANDIVEVQEEDLIPDVVSPEFKLRGEWNPSNGQLPIGRRIGDTYLVNAIGIAPYDNLVPGLRVLFRTIDVFEVLTGTQGAAGPQGDPGQSAVTTWEYKNADFNVVSGVGYIVDTTSNPVVATLPVTLTSTFYVPFKDAAGTFGTNNFSIARGSVSYTILGSPTNLVCDYNYPDLELAYDSTTNNVVI